jgi:hypothetical protein
MPVPNWAEGIKTGDTVRVSDEMLFGGGKVAWVEDVFDDGVSIHGSWTNGFPFYAWGELDQIVGRPESPRKDGGR